MIKITTRLYLLSLKKKRMCLWWKENSFIIERIPPVPSNQSYILRAMSLTRNIFYTFRYSAFILVAMIALNWQFYFWIDVYVGAACSILIFVGFSFFILTRNYLSQQHFLSPIFVKLGRFLINLTFKFLISLI
jgi:hypothetical protein